MTAHSFRLQFGLDIIKRIEILYFAGNAAFETGCIKTGNRTNPAFARHNRFPKSLEASSVRRQNTHAGNDGAISFHDLGLTIATGDSRRRGCELEFRRQRTTPTPRDGK